MQRGINICYTRNLNNKEEIKKEIPYREVVGSLMYLMVATRPDISFALGKVARVMGKLTKENWTEVKRIFKYLQGTSNYGIT